MCRSCSTTSATLRSRSVWLAVFTAVAAASSQDWVLVPITSITRYTLMASSWSGARTEIVGRDRAAVWQVIGLLLLYPGPART